jgi:ethanolamine-phosphate cytidylyltransferase
MIGKYLTIPRTEGISTTDIVGRMLLMTRDHHASSLTVDTPAEVSVLGSGVGGRTVWVRLRCAEILDHSAIG